MAVPYTDVGPSISQEDWHRAVELAEQWKDVHTSESYGPQGKNLGTLARAFLHLKLCYDELVVIHGD